MRKPLSIPFRWIGSILPPDPLGETPLAGSQWPEDVHGRVGPIRPTLHRKLHIGRKSKVPKGIRIVPGNP
jgi:hypothetical protein